MEQFDEYYHSKHGAVQEAKHVYLKMGLEHWANLHSSVNRCHVFEMGFGTGLNALLTAQKAAQLQLEIDYHSIEAYPLTSSELKEVDYNDYLSAKDKEVFDSIIAEEKIREQEKYIREFFTANWTADWGGIQGYRKFIQMRREIKKRREREVYNQMRARKNFLYNTKMGILIGTLGLVLVYMVWFLIDMIVEASK